MSQRKAFNFYYSYYDIAKELSEKDRTKFLWAILQKQFENIDPVLDGMAKFAYSSQLHSITSQVDGYITKCKGLKIKPFDTPTVGASVGVDEGGLVGAYVQEKGQRQVQGELTLPKTDVLEINFLGLLDFINKTFGKKFKVINDVTKSKFKARLKDGYTKEDFSNAITNASKDKFHIESGFKWCTPEFFSRSTTLDKYGFKSSTKEDNRIIIPIDAN